MNTQAWLQSLTAIAAGFAAGNKIFSGTIRHYPANPYRRVELAARLSRRADRRQAIGPLEGRRAEVRNRAASPFPAPGRHCAARGSGDAIAMRGAA